MLLLLLPLPLCKRLPNTDDRFTVPWIDDSLERGSDVVDELAEDRPESVCDGKTRDDRAALRRAVSRAVNLARFCAPQSSEAESKGRTTVQKEHSVSAYDKHLHARHTHCLDTSLLFFLQAQRRVRVTEVRRGRTRSCSRVLVPSSLLALVPDGPNVSVLFFNPSTSSCAARAVMALGKRL